LGQGFPTAASTGTGAPISCCLGMMTAPKTTFRAHLSSASIAFAALVAVTPVGAQAAPSQQNRSAPAAAPASTLQSELLRPANADLRAFYYYRQNRPLWTADGRLTPAALVVAEMIRTADIDGLRPAEVHADELDRALLRVRTEGSQAAADEAEIALSRSFSDFVQLTRRAPEGAMLYEHVSLAPQDVPAQGALHEAAAAPSLAEYVRSMGWLHPLYAPVREAFLEGSGQDLATRRLVMTNLARIRAIPAAPPGGRYVLVNAAAAQLWMYENGKPVDTMKVVVGKADHQTPMMSGYIRYAILNPYWNVPADFSRDKIAPAVVRQGSSYLKARGYQVMSDWTPEATVIDPSSVNWRAVADGGINLRVRQLPGVANSMGKVKFEFPNALGIYLHDTPQQNLMTEQARQFSSGCVRLQDAPRLGRWLFRGAMPVGDETEERVDLPQVVPVYITYLTVQPGENGQLALLDDPYDRDKGGQRTLQAALR